MLRYVRGRGFEYRIKQKLEGQGYFVVRAAASRPVDLVAIKDGRAILVECKVGKNPTKDVLKKLERYKRESGCRILVAVQKGLKLELKEL